MVIKVSCFCQSKKQEIQEKYQYHSKATFSKLAIILSGLDILHGDFSEKGKEKAKYKFSTQDFVQSASSVELHLAARSDFRMLILTLFKDS